MAGELSLGSPPPDALLELLDLVGHEGCEALSLNPNVELPHTQVLGEHLHSKAAFTCCQKAHVTEMRLTRLLYPTLLFAVFSFS